MGVLQALSVADPQGYSRLYTAGTLEGQ